jgi:MFS family permease
MKTGYYGWVIAGVGALVTTTALGFGRFAYSVLLPDMRESLGFHYTQMGLLSGAILLGYLLFSLICGLLATRFGSKRVLVASLLCSSLSMFSLSLFSGFLPLLFFAFLMGAGAAGAHISIATIIMSWFDKKLLGRAVGIVTGGTGLGIVLTGMFLPSLLVSLGKDGWRECWVLMAMATLMVCTFGIFLLRERPIQSGQGSLTTPEGRGPGFVTGKGDSLTLRYIFLIYFIFGFAYIIYATYFMAYMVEEISLPGKVAGDIWSIFGWMCMVSGWVWGIFSDRIGRRKALVWNNGIISLAVFLPLHFPQTFLLSLSTFLFGFTFLGTVTIIAACIGDQPIERKASVYGLLTLIHGLGQLLGSILGGYLKDLTGSFQLTLLISLIGFILCFLMASISRKK